MRIFTFSLILCSDTSSITFIACSSNFIALYDSYSIGSPFLLIGLRQQLAKIHNCSLSTTDSAQNLGFIFDSRLTFSDQISSL